MSVFRVRHVRFPRWAFRPPNSLVFLELLDPAGLFPALGPPSGPFRVRFGVFSDVRFPCTACPFSAGASFWWCFVRPLGFPLAPGSWLSRVGFWYQGGENNNQFAHLFRLKMRPLVVFPSAKWPEPSGAWLPNGYCIPHSINHPSVSSLLTVTVTVTTMLPPSVCPYSAIHIL